MSTIDRLTPLDRMMLGVSSRWPQDVGALVLLEDDAGLDLGTLRRVIDAGLPLAPRFRQRLLTPRRGLGPPYWVDDAEFHLARHVREQVVAAPGDETALLATVERLRRRALDLTRPLWEVWLLTGLAGGRRGLYVRIHHAVADGMAAMATISSFLQDDPAATAASPPSWSPRPAPSDLQLLVDNLRRRLAGVGGWVRVLAHPRALGRRVRAQVAAYRTLLAVRPAPRTSLTRMIGGDRTVTLLRADLSALKAVGHAHGATVNDVLLAATTAGARRLLHTRGELAEGSIVHTYSPVSLRPRRRGPQQGNLLAQMIVPLPVGEPDPARRLRTIARETARSKERAHTSLELMVANRLMRSLTLAIAVRRRVNLTTANLPGPGHALHLNGARVREVYPLIPLIADEPLGVGALSYAGVLYIGVVADPAVVPDLEVFTEAVRRELEGPGRSGPPPAPRAPADAVAG